MSSVVKWMKKQIHAENKKFSDSLLLLWF